MKKIEEVLATGRRKCAVARVRLSAGTGKVTLNGKEMTEYFPSEALCNYVAQVFKAADVVGKFDIAANLDGGGMTGQAGALRHGIARALLVLDEACKQVLKDNGMLTRDSREKERKKPGQPGARRRFQFSKR